MSIVLKNGFVYDGNFDRIKTDIKTDGTKISAMGSDLRADKVFDLTGLTVYPGFIDMHIHGCGGADTCDATPDSLKTMSDTLVKNGITSFCPTSMTLSFDELRKIFANVASVKNRTDGAYIHGVNMEGPYISMAKKGAQNGDFVRNPDKDEFMRLYNGCCGCISIVDIAPECEGAEDFIKSVSPICPVSTAHTSADYNDEVRAIEWGVRHTTHLYNAMSGLNHRSPGVVGAVLDNAGSRGVRAELICDGFHIHPAALRIAFAMLGEDNSVIVSDSMRAADFRDGEYDLGGQTVYVKDGKALLADGTIAASTTNLHKEFVNVIKFGIPEKQAVKSVTINPAKAIRVDKKTGSLDVGKSADIVVMDDEYNIRLVIVRGEVKVENL